jgi:hypothetical protein
MDILENEQRLKLSTSNIIALTAVLLTFIGGYINIKSTQTEFNQRITALEKANDETKAGFSKFDFKLDKISESLNQLKVDMASKRVDETKK